MSADPSAVGRRLHLQVGAVAHGGHCVARTEGRVVFVRHALPGERVVAVVTAGRESDPFWRADAVEVLEAAPGRVDPPCPYAGPGRCGGCDWQHADLPVQRGLKAAVVEEALRRIGGLAVPGADGPPVVVEPAPGDAGGLGWRTRVTFAVDEAGCAGLRPYRSHEVLPVAGCLIAHPGVEDLGVESRRWPGVGSVEAVTSSTGQRLVEVRARPGATPRLPRWGADVGVLLAADDGTGRRPTPRRVRGRGYVTERSGGRSWRVSGGGFWQLHPGAADTLVTAVLAALEPRPGERVLDLYSGVGLFAGVLAGRVGGSGAVVAVESDPRAAADARRNLHADPHVRLVADRVDRALRSAVAPPVVDLVVLDPPRAGAGRAVVEALADRRPRAIAYVACDPAALARDVALLAARGYRLARLRAFDLFPMTHHVECVATLVPARSA